jgi:hypothetical protein
MENLTLPELDAAAAFFKNPEAIKTFIKAELLAEKLHNMFQTEFTKRLKSQSSDPYYIIRPKD